MPTLPPHDPRPKTNATGQVSYTCPVCEGGTRNISGNIWKCDACCVEFLRDGKRK